jgi:hypothetical protein
VGDDDCSAVLGGVADDRDDHGGHEEVRQVRLVREGLDRVDEDLRDQRGDDGRDGKDSDRTLEGPDPLRLFRRLVHGSMPAELPPGDSDVEHEEQYRNRQ